METYTVYAIVLCSTGDAYVGITLNKKARFSQHRTALKRGGHYNVALQEAWSRFGSSSFEFILLEEGISPIDSTGAERRYIEQMGTLNVIRLDESADKGNVYTENMRAAQREYIRSYLGRETARKNANRRWADPKEAAKLRSGLEKSINDPEVLTKRNAAISAAASTDEARKVRSKNSRAYWDDPASKAAASARQKAGWTPERRAAASARMKANNPAKTNASTAQRPT